VYKKRMCRGMDDNAEEQDSGRNLKTEIDQSKEPQSDCRRREVNLTGGLPSFRHRSQCAMSLAIFNLLDEESDAGGDQAESRLLCLSNVTGHPHYPLRHGAEELSQVVVFGTCWSFCSSLQDFRCVL